MSAPVICDILEKAGYQITYKILLPDERGMLSREMARLADENIADLILTTGGTGFSPRDCMPEATMDICERQVPGIPEAMRAFTMQVTKRSMLNRSAAGIRGDVLIVNLPGNAKAVKQCLDYLLPEITHAVEVIKGE